MTAVSRNAPRLGSRGAAGRVRTSGPHLVGPGGPDATNGRARARSTRRATRGAFARVRSHSHTCSTRQPALRNARFTSRSRALLRAESHGCEPARTCFLSPRGVCELRSRWAMSGRECLPYSSHRAVEKGALRCDPRNGLLLSALLDRTAAPSWWRRRRKGAAQRRVVVLGGSLRGKGASLPRP